MDARGAFESHVVVSASEGSAGDPEKQGVQNLGTRASGQLSEMHRKQRGEHNGRWSLEVSADTCPHLLPSPPSFSCVRTQRESNRTCLFLWPSLNSYSLGHAERAAAGR